jgi:hypothetical protein
MATGDRVVVRGPHRRTCGGCHKRRLCTEVHETLVEGKSHVCIIRCDECRNGRTRRPGPSMVPGPSQQVQAI